VKKFFNSFNGQILMNYSVRISSQVLFCKGIKHSKSSQTNYTSYIHTEIISIFREQTQRTKREGRFLDRNKAKSRNKYDEDVYCFTTKAVLKPRLSDFSHYILYNIRGIRPVLSTNCTVFGYLRSH
jgi:hypothetical protein